MKESRRIASKDWADFNVVDCVFDPKNWTREGLEEELRAAYRRFYSYPNIVRRFNRRSLRLMVATLFTKLGFRRFRA